MVHKKVLFVFRKRNQGNFSIEKIYENILNQLIARETSIFQYRKQTLKHTYDIFGFLITFFKSLASKQYIVHVTGGCNYMVMAFPGKKRILTIHDCYHYQNFKGIKREVYDWLYYKLPIRYSHCVVAVSEKTQNELFQLFPKEKNKIKRIENPLPILRKQIKLRERTFSENEKIHVLQIGTKPLKNYERLIQATKKMNVYYHFVHAKPSNIQSLIQKHHIESRAKVYSNIDEEQLYGLYYKIDVLFFASEAEGFGLPIIEAQAFGIPVITSNTEPFKKIAKGAVFTDPYSIDAIKKTFEKLYDSDFINPKIFEGIQNANRYDVEKISHKYYLLYTCI